MRILTHAVNSSLFPDTDLDSVTWTGPPPEIVTVQSLLYASLATSLFAVFLAMLGKQWVNRYLRNRGGSAADKSRDRQRKLDGFQKWKIYPAIENLPVTLQFGLLLLGCTLSLYPWTISRTVAGIILAFTLFGVASYIFLSLAATLYYDCPYQTPPSIIRIATMRLKCSDAAVARSLWSLIASLSSLDELPVFFVPEFVVLWRGLVAPQLSHGKQSTYRSLLSWNRPPGSSEGLQGRCSLHLLDFRAHHGSRRNIVHCPVHSRCLGLTVDMCDPDIFQLRHPIHISPRLQHIRNPTQGKWKHAAEGSFGFRGQVPEDSASITMLDSLKPFWLCGRGHRIRADVLNE